MTGLVLALVLAAAPAPCVLSGADGALRVRARCDALQVPAGIAGAQPVSVGYAIVEAKTRTPAPDPIVFLAGGPGQASTRVAPLVARALAGARRERAIVFFDARGTGRSTPFECADDRPRAERLKTPMVEVPALRDACLAKAPLDPRSITTAQIARDLEEVRKALGAERLNLVGGSYGTRLALTYDALFPGRVRAMVLDGVAPAAMVLGEGMTEDMNAALLAADARCRASAACAAAGRPLVDIVRDAMKRPAAVVDLPHPRTGAPTQVEIDGRAVAGVVRMSLYADEATAVLPPLLRALDAGDARPVAAQVLMLEAQEGEINVQMNLSVVCAEDVPFLSDAPAAEGPLPDVRVELRRGCASWPHAQLARDVHEPKPSSTPTLLLSGEHDPVTPPARAEEARKHLARSTHVVVPGVGHGVFFRGCVPELVTRFLDNPDAAVDATCARTMGPFPLFSDAMGP